MVAETRTQGCDVFQNKNHHAQIVVPSIPPSETIDCKIIKIQYRLRVCKVVQRIDQRIKSILLLNYNFCLVSF